MMERIKKFYKKYEKIQDLKKSGQHKEVMAQAGGDSIEKYKRKIGDEYRILNKLIQKSMNEVEIKQIKAAAEKPVTTTTMRTRKRDEKKKEVPPPPPPPAPVASPNKKKKPSPKKEEEAPDMFKVLSQIKKESNEI